MFGAGTRRSHGFVTAAIGLIFAAVAASAAAADIVTTPGFGRFTMCRNWLVYNSCTSYGRVTLPERIAVGDHIELTYGSNPKHYLFQVVRLRQQGDRCTILSARSGPNDQGEKIEVAPCGKAKPPAGDR